MLDDYRRTFPYKLIGPIIDTEQLPTGDQLDQRRSLFPRCPARNNWCSLPPPPLCFPKKWKQKIVVDRKREGGAEGDQERERERGGKRSKKDERKTKIRADSSKRDGERGMKRGRRRGTRKKKRRADTDTETSRGPISIGGRLTLDGSTNNPLSVHHLLFTSSTDRLYP